MDVVKVGSVTPHEARQSYAPKMFRRNCISRENQIRTRSMPARLGAVLCVAMTAFSSFATADHTSQDPTRVERCMLTVLSSITKVEVLNSDTPPETMTYKFPYFFVKYRSSGNVMSFDVEKYRAAGRDTYTFVANLPSASEAYDSGTRAILRKWKLRCGATVLVFE